MKRTLLGALALTILLTGPAGPAAAAPESAAVQIRIQAAPALTPEATQRAAEIYGVLRAGVPESDAALNAHLWEMARSLAERGDWTPPRVTVRLVPREAPAR